jgi:hypothetical protein
LPVLSIVDVPGVKVPILVEIGKIGNVIYEPPKGSRKQPYTYKHDMENTKLLTDSTGKGLYLKGNTYLDIYDGWLKR